MSTARTITLGLLAVGAAVGACSSIVDLEVTHERGPVEDTDERSAAGDAASEESPAPPIDGGEDARADALPAFAACSCPKEQGCCLPGNGPGVCTDTSGAAACTASSGLFLRCAAGDVENGRSCCLAADRTSSFFAAACEDGATQVCADDAECSAGVCHPTVCRMVILGLCAPEGGAPSGCAP